jgi:hypothetical protein
MVLPDSGISDIVPDEATFWGAGLCFFRCFWLYIFCLGSNDLWTFDHIWVILCLRVNKCLLIMSADPITRGLKTIWTKYYVLFSHPSGFFQIMYRVWLLRVVLYISVARWQRVQIDSLLFDWELREEFNNVRQGMIFVAAQVCQGFSPLVWMKGKWMLERGFFDCSLKNKVEWQFTS